MKPTTTTLRDAARAAPVSDLLWALRPTTVAAIVADLDALLAGEEDPSYAGQALLRVAFEARLEAIDLLNAIVEPDEALRLLRAAHQAATGGAS